MRTGVQRRAHGSIDQRQAVETRQHDVDNRGIVAAFEGQLDAPLAVGRDVYRVTAFCQSLADKVRNRRIVFHHEHSHILRVYGTRPIRSTSPISYPPAPEG